jgi:hypothetical protein
LEGVKRKQKLGVDLGDQMSLRKKRPKNCPTHFLWVSDPLCLSSSLVLHFFLIILFGSTTLLTGMTSNSLHMQWRLTSQLHGSGFLLWIKLNALPKPFFKSVLLFTAIPICYRQVASRMYAT